MPAVRDALVSDPRPGIHRTLLTRGEFWLFISVLGAAAASFLAIRQPVVLVAAVAAVLVLICLTSEAALASALVLSTFLSRFSVDVGRLTVRPEIATAGVAVLSLIVGRSRAHRPELSWIALFLGAWLLGLSVTSALRTPDQGQSERLLLWLSLDLVAFFWIATRSRRVLIIVLKVGLLGTLLSQVVGIVCWLGALSDRFLVLVQPDPAYGGYAAYGMSLEANVFAGLTTLWAVVAVSTRVAAVVGWKHCRVLVVLLSPLTSIAAHTRAAFVVSIGLCLFLALRSARRSQLLLFVPVALVACWTALQFVAQILGLGKFTQLFEFSSGTGQYRANSWVQAVIDLRTHPIGLLVGFELNAFGQRHLDPTLFAPGASWFLSNLPLQVLYDGGTIAVILASGALFLVAHQTRGPTRLFFIAAYVALGSQASTLWLLQTWVFAGLYPIVVSGRSSDGVEQESRADRAAMERAVSADVPSRGP